MSIEVPGVEAEVYEQLTERARKHFGESSLSAIVKVGDYDPSRPSHDFSQVFFEANPNMFTPAIFWGLASALAGKRPRDVREAVVEPFEPQIDDIAASAKDRKLMVISGHQTMFEPAYAVYGLQRALARHTGNSYADMAERTHLIAARALATVDIFGRISLTSVAQQLTNLYYSFPDSVNYRGDDSIPLQFQRASNAAMLEQYGANTGEPGTIGIMAASGTTEKKDQRNGMYVIPRIKGDKDHGTMGVLLQGWDLLFVGGIFKHGLQAEPAQLIPADEVSPDVIHDSMDNVIAASRNAHGVPTVYGEA